MVVDAVRLRTLRPRKRGHLMHAVPFRVRPAFAAVLCMRELPCDMKAPEPFVSPRYRALTAIFLARNGLRHI